MCLHVGAVQQDLGWRTACSSQCLEQVLPDTLGRPTDEPIVERLSRAILGWNVDPTAARLQRHDDAADDPAIVDPRHTPWFVRQQRCKSLPLRIAQPEPLRHSFAPSTGTVNHSYPRRSNRFMGPDPSTTLALVRLRGVCVSDWDSVGYALCPVRATWVRILMLGWCLSLAWSGGARGASGRRCM
jgi:hypothetical protein